MKKKWAAGQKRREGNLVKEKPEKKSVEKARKRLWEERYLGFPPKGEQVQPQPDPELTLQRINITVRRN
tara:strand:- start:363 stop:569 length:207 start_codon:yes stop_codon:yes gene_type:complete